MLNISFEGKIYIYIDTCSKVKNSYVFGIYFDNFFKKKMHIYKCYTYFQVRNPSSYVQSKVQECIGYAFEQHL